MNCLRRISLTLAAALLSACASVPPEAPELSAQLGVRISAIEAAHNRLLEQYFAEKQRRVDEFIQDVWVPVFATEFFGDPKIEAVWKQVVASTDPQDRLRFITIVGPALQAKINRKRLELIKPLEDLHRQVQARLKLDYDQARAINNTLTSFLQSASKVEANRKRYLDMLGIGDQQVDKFIDETDQAVSGLVDKTQALQDKEHNAEAYLGKIKQVIEKLKS